MCGGGQLLRFVLEVLHPLLFSRVLTVRSVKPTTEIDVVWVAAHSIDSLKAENTLIT